MTATVSERDRKRFEPIVLLAARRYARRCWWASGDDLIQTGWMAVLTSLPNFDPLVGVPVEAFVYKAVVFAMKRHLWGESSPVSGGWHRPALQRVAQRAPLEDNTPLPVTEHPDELLASYSWNVSVRNRLNELAGPLSTAVLLEDMSAVNVAQEYSVPVETVYRETSKARRQASEDSQLWELMRDRKTWEEW